MRDGVGKVGVGAGQGRQGGAIDGWGGQGGQIYGERGVAWGGCVCVLGFGEGTVLVGGCEVSQM